MPSLAVDPRRSRPRQLPSTLLVASRTHTPQAKPAHKPDGNRTST
eukprot:gene2969-8180_t